jgi:hypothetical protein
VYYYPPFAYQRVTFRRTRRLHTSSARSIRREENPPSPAPVFTSPNAEKIDHIVVLMMENRSFDHVQEAQAGLLPSVSFLEPNFHVGQQTNDDHPPTDMSNGQKLVLGCICPARAFASAVHTLEEPV